MANESQSRSLLARHLQRLVLKSTLHQKPDGPNSACSCWTQPLCINRVSPAPSLFCPITEPSLHTWWFVVASWETHQTRTDTLCFSPDQRKPTEGLSERAPRWRYNVKAVCLFYRFSVMLFTTSCCFKHGALHVFFFRETCSATPGGAAVLHCFLSSSSGPMSVLALPRSPQYDVRCELAPQFPASGV